MQRYKQPQALKLERIQGDLAHSFIIMWGAPALARLVVGPWTQSLPSGELECVFWCLEDSPPAPIAPWVRTMMFPVWLIVGLLRCPPWIFSDGSVPSVFTVASETSQGEDVPWWLAFWPLLFVDQLPYTQSLSFGLGNYVITLNDNWWLFKGQ